jgi:hypothetical protein
MTLKISLHVIKMTICRVKIRDAASLARSPSVGGAVLLKLPNRCYDPFNVCHAAVFNNYHTTPCNNPEDHSFHQHRGGSLKSMFNH